MLNEINLNCDENALPVFESVICARAPVFNNFKCLFYRLYAPAGGQMYIYTALTKYLEMFSFEFCFKTR